MSPVASAVSVIHQMEDLVSSEILSSRLSSQIFCWLVNKNNNEPVDYPTPFDGDITEYEGMSDEQIKELVKEEQKENVEQIVTLRKAKESCVAFEQLPDGFESQ